MFPRQEEEEKQQQHKKKLLLGPLSIVRGQKPDSKDNVTKTNL